MGKVDEYTGLRQLFEVEQAATIADELEEELSEIEKVIEAQRLVGNYDVEQICMAMAK